MQYSFGTGLITPGEAVARDISYTVPGFSSIAPFRLPDGNYTSVVRVYDAVGMWTPSEAENVTVTSAALSAAGELLVNAVASCLDELVSLGQSSALMTVSDGLAASINDDSCGAGGEGEACAANRRLLGSSAAYRLRIRKLLLMKMSQSSVRTDLSAESAPKVLESVHKLAKNPREILSDAAESSLFLYMSGCAYLLADRLRSGGLKDIVTLSESTCSSAEYTPTPAAADKLLIGSKEGLQNAANVYVRSMTPDEEPVVVALPGAGVMCVRQFATDTVFVSPNFYGSYVTYTHGKTVQGAYVQSSATRQQDSFTGSALVSMYDGPRVFVTDTYANTLRQGHASGRTSSRRQQQTGSARSSSDALYGPGVYVIHYPRVWKPIIPDAFMSDVIGVSAVRGDAIPPPLLPSVDLHTPNKCTTPRCVNVWLQMKVPPQTLTPGNTTNSDIALFARFLRCLHWNNYDEWTKSVCTYTNVTYMDVNQSLRVHCACDSDGFVYAEWARPPLPPYHALQTTLQLHFISTWAVLTYLCVTGACLAIVNALLFVSARCMILYQSRKFITFEVNSMPLWSTDGRVRAMETFWMSMINPYVKYLIPHDMHEPALNADFGVVSVNDAGNTFWEEQNLNSVARRTTSLENVAFDFMTQNQKHGLTSAVRRTPSMGNAVRDVVTQNQNSDDEHVRLKSGSPQNIGGVMGTYVPVTYDGYQRVVDVQVTDVTCYNNSIDGKKNDGGSQNSAHAQVNRAHENINEENEEEDENVVIFDRTQTQTWDGGVIVEEPLSGVSR
jgi:hypothetical protein